MPARGQPGLAAAVVGSTAAAAVAAAGVTAAAEAVYNVDAPRRWICATRPVREQ